MYSWGGGGGVGDLRTSSRRKSQGRVQLLGSPGCAGSWPVEPAWSSGARWPSTGTTAVPRGLEGGRRGREALGTHNLSSLEQGQAGRESQAAAPRAGTTLIPATKGPAPLTQGGLSAGSLGQIRASPTQGRPAKSHAGNSGWKERGCPGLREDTEQPGLTRAPEPLL